MKRLIMVIIALSLMTTAFAFDELWQKAQRIMDNSWRLVPGQTTITSRTLNNSGDVAVVASDDTCPNTNRPRGGVGGVMQESEIVISHARGGRGTIVSELVSSSGAQQMEIDARLDRDMTPQRESMFFETNNRNIQVTKLDETKTINDVQTQAFSVSFTPRGERSATESKVWLCTTTGAPVLVEAQPPVNQPMVNSVNRTTFYTFDAENNRAFTHREEFVTSISAMGMNITNESVIVMEGHWEHR